MKKVLAVIMVLVMTMSYSAHADTDIFTRAVESFENMTVHRLFMVRITPDESFDFPCKEAWMVVGTDWTESNVICEVHVMDYEGEIVFSERGTYAEDMDPNIVETVYWCWLENQHWEWLDEYFGW